MAIALQGTISSYESASSTTAVVPYPSGIVAGELLLAHIAFSGSTPPTAVPSGWTQLQSVDGGATISGAAYYRVATGSETGSVTWTSTSAAGRTTGYIARWSGVDTTTPIDVASANGINNGSGLSVTCPSVTTVTANVMLVYSAEIDAATAADISTPSGLTLLADTTGTGRRLALFSRTQATAGATGTQVFNQTSTTALEMIAIVVPLRPGTTATDYTANPADSEAITDSASFVQAQQLSPADSEAITDTTAAVQDMVRAASDSEALTDTVAAVQSIVRAPADSEAITDAAGAVQGIVRAPADALGLTDAVSLVQTQQLGLADSVGITDSASAVLNAGSTNYTANPADSEAITDAASVVTDTVRAPADALGITDSIAAVQSQQLSLTDSVGLTDSLTLAAGTVRTGADSAGLSDTVSTTLDVVRTAADQAGITDSVAVSFGFGLTRTDQVGLTDSVSARLDRVVTVSDTVGITYTVQQSGATRDLILKSQALQQRLAPAPLPARLAVAPLSRFALALVQRFDSDALAARFTNVPLGGSMSTTIHVSKGEKQYAGGQITETTGKDITGATFMVSLGSADVPGVPAVADKNVIPPGAGNNVRLVAKLIDNTVALGRYWVWIHVGDTPENVLIPVQEIIVA